MIEPLIELVITIWKADTEMRDSSVVGESPLDKKSRNLVARLSGSLLFLLLVAGIAWICFSLHFST